MERNVKTTLFATALAVASCISQPLMAYEKLLIEDFESYDVGTVFNVVNSERTVFTNVSAVVEVDPDDSSNKVLHLSLNATQVGVELSIPEQMSVGEVTEDYYALLFDYRKSASDNGGKRTFYAFSGSDIIYRSSSSSVPSSSEEWVTLNYTMKEITSDNTWFAMGFYGTGYPDFYIDNVILEGGDLSYMDDETRSTRYWADLAGVDLGCCIGSHQTRKDDTQAKAFYKSFNTLVAEWEMKFSVTEPSFNTFDYTAGDAILSFAEEHGMKLRGHTLCWHESLPSWVSSNGYANSEGWTKEQLLAILKNHITNVVDHWKGKVYEWDVLNEVLSDDQSIVNTKSTGYTLRNTVWYTVIGESFIDSAFVWAHRTDPEAKLYLNDYGVEHWDKNKTKAYYNLVKKLKRRGVPIDGVGLQCHYSLGDPDSLQILETVVMFTSRSMGMEVKFTECDLKLNESDFNNVSAYREQARYYRFLTNIMLKRESVTGLLMWGINDSKSWVNSSTGTVQGQAYLLDKYFGMKPAYEAVREALRQSYTTGVTTSWNSPENLPGAVYDLDGHKVATAWSAIELDGLGLPGGIYMMNGKKYLIR